MGICNARFPEGAPEQRKGSVIPGQFKGVGLIRSKRAKENGVDFLRSPGNRQDKRPTDGACHGVIPCYP